LIPRRPTVIAPRGEFAPGALRLRAGRKRAYIAATKALGLARGILWQASGTHESTDIRRALGHRTEVVIAPDLAIALPPTEANLVEKRRGHLRLMFVGRIAPMKNLDGALKLLKGVTGDIEFDVYGPIEDGTYWSHCQQLMAKLPSTIKVTYRGEVNPDRIGDVIGAHDLLFMPSLGENFGHVILEAMCNGRPVLISDRTRWRGLEAAGVGWDVPLEKPDRYRQVLAACVAMGEPEWHVMSEKATRFGSAFVEDPASREQNRLLFRSALDKHSAIGPASRLAG
jgi:glycosyltransferase involved in cell wall biosynthesis